MALILGLILFSLNLPIGKYTALLIICYNIIDSIYDGMRNLEKEDMVTVSFDKDTDIYVNNTTTPQRIQLTHTKLNKSNLTAKEKPDWTVITEQSTGSKAYDKPTPRIANNSETIA